MNKNPFLLMPRDVYGDYVETGDVMSFNKPSKHKIVMVNLSCKYIRKAAFFLRNYNSIFRQITSAEHPLNRVILNCNGEHYLLKCKI